MSIYYPALYTVTNSNYGNVYKNKSLVEIDQECAGIARIVEAEIQQPNIPTEYEIQVGKAIEIGSSSTSNPRLSIEYGKNSIRKGNSTRFTINNTNSITEVSGRFFNGSDWNKQTILIQSG